METDARSVSERLRGVGGQEDRDRRSGGVDEDGRKRRRPRPSAPRRVGRSGRDRRQQEEEERDVRREPVRTDRESDEERRRGDARPSDLAVRLPRAAEGLTAGRNSEEGRQKEAGGSRLRERLHVAAAGIVPHHEASDFLAHQVRKLPGERAHPRAFDRVAKEEPAGGAPQERAGGHPVLHGQVRVEALRDPRAEAAAGAAQQEHGAGDGRHGEESEARQARPRREPSGKKQDEDAREPKEQPRARAGKKEATGENQGGERVQPGMRAGSPEGRRDEDQGERAQETKRVRIRGPSAEASRQFPVRLRFRREETGPLQHPRERGRADPQQGRLQGLRAQGRALAAQDQEEDRARGQRRQRHEAFAERGAVGETAAVDGAALQPVPDGPEGRGPGRRQYGRHDPNYEKRPKRTIERRGLGPALEIVNETKEPSRGQTPEEKRRPGDRVGPSEQPRQQARAREEEGEQHDRPPGLARRRDRQADRYQQDRQAIRRRRRKSHEKQQARPGN